jgi:hypothetical protein
MTTSCPVLQSTKISINRVLNNSCQICGPRKWQTTASIINSRSGWMLYPQVANNIIWGPGATPSRQNLLALKWLLPKQDICCNEEFPNINKTDTEPKTNWNQTQIGGWPNPSNPHRVLSTTIMQGAQGRACIGWVKMKMKQRVEKMKMRQRRVERTNGFVLGFFSWSNRRQGADRAQGSWERAGRI